GFDRAQVTRGGIRLNEVSDNLESRLSKKLFITGEMLDIDGPCGGYNLHWAFSSALRAAKAIINYGKNR
ncbi:MAG: NAD(P)/FAD-dependent oxidoreductase, partial [Clostridia bacterium]|nr:NAD(P)/FAD-dependent oxidoreductase [Clostridia bacterium]